ncbi:MAG: Fic family protein [Eubacteriales bacterium]|nr:Fic family protein [Eubacteriales bacterium]
MDYKLLSHIYYENKAEYEKLYNLRFNGESTIKLPVKINSNTIFFCPCLEIFNLQNEIMNTNLKIHDIAEKLPQIALTQFAKASMLGEIEQTNEMEGVHSSRHELNMVLNNLNEGGPKKRFSGLVNKYNLMTSNKIPLESCEDIRHLYDELVLSEVIEDEPENFPDGLLFRKDLAEVTSITHKVIHKGSYPEAKITEEISCALKILNDKSIPDIIRISIFHYLFGYIHPFYDGNGRTSRFISSYLLSQQLEFLIGYRLSYTIKENKKDYYTAFEICNDTKSKGDITPFIIIFMEIINKAMSNLYYSLNKKWNELNNYMKLIDNIPYFKDDTINAFCYVLLQARLFSDYGITKKELQAGFSVSLSTIEKRLNAMGGYLKKQKLGKLTYYEFDIEKLNN